MKGKGQGGLRRRHHEGRPQEKSAKPQARKRYHSCVSSKRLERGSAVKDDRQLRLLFRGAALRAALKNVNQAKDGGFTAWGNWPLRIEGIG